MVEQDAAISKEEVNLPLTKQVFVVGVPLEAFAFIFLFSALFMLIAGLFSGSGANPFMLLIGLPLWYVAKLLFEWDSHLIAVIRAWGDFGRMRLTAGFWGGSTLGQAPVRKRFNESDVR